ncbi:hypothetical protein [Usitatibacter rugosus]|uniref:hypothetical protein n=1 Tax=Usitatibacter rugosus TaxID=2732067 RepID=UPI00148949D9|nr:hypothetical protein [Usitatibacter rugosus]
MNMRRLPILFVALCLIGSSAALAQRSERELLEEVTKICNVREQTTELMVAGRDRGIAKSEVLTKLPPLTFQSSTFDRATYSRLNDVYAYPKLTGRTLKFHRVAACLRDAITGVEPKFRDGLGAAMLECQSAPPSTDEALSSCIIGAHSANLTN